METRINRRQIIAVSAIATTGALSRTSARAQSTSATPAPSPITLPDTPAGQQLQWIIDVVNGDTPIPGESEIVQRFAKVFLDQVPIAEMIGLFQQLANQFAPVTVEHIGGIPTPLVLDVLVSTKGGDEYIVSISVEDNPDHRINALLFTPFSREPLATPTLNDWQDLTIALMSAGPNVAVHAEEPAAQGDRRYIEEMNPFTVLAIGSVFKLYVLGALATKIEQGELAWDQELVVTDDVKSIPSGVTQNEPDGTKLTIEELSRRMISISDNTATDMLMRAVSREACEAALVTQGNRNADRNIPFLTTREIFVLKHPDNVTLRQQYIEADVAARREILAKLDGQPLPSLDAVAALNEPVAIEEIEWFATAPEMSEAMVWLWAKRSDAGLEPIQTILTINSGVPYDESIWKQVAFKGGSEPGVLALCWLLERKDGRTFTLSAGVNNPDKAISEDKVIAVVAAAFHLLSEVA